MSVTLSTEDQAKEAKKKVLGELWDSIVKRRLALELLVFDQLAGSGVEIWNAFLEELTHFAYLLDGKEHKLSLVEIEGRLKAESVDGGVPLLFLVQHSVGKCRDELTLFFARQVETGKELDKLVTGLEKRWLATKKNELWTRMDDLRVARRRKLTTIGAAIVAFVILGLFGRNWFQKRSALVARESYLASSNGVRIVDISAIKDALAKYHVKYGTYPRSSQWDGLYSCWGKSTPDWITGLVPEFIPELKHDPRNNTACDEQYLYVSNGIDYKLLAHKAPDCVAVKAIFPEMINPGRGCGASAAYGYWTPAARMW